MSQYTLLVYEEEVEPAEQAERERTLPLFDELHRSLSEAGLLSRAATPTAPRAYERAITLTANAVERGELERRLGALR